MNEHYITQKPTVVKDMVSEPKRYTLDEALKTGMPVYTRALNITSEVNDFFEKGIKPVDNILTDGYGIEMDCRYHKVIKDCFLYNVIRNIVEMYNVGMLIPTQKGC